MNSSDIQAKIQAAAVQFTEEIVAVFGEAFAGIAADLAGKAPAKAKPVAKKVAPKKVVAKKAAPAPKRAPKAAKPAAKAAKPAAKPAAKAAKPAAKAAAPKAAKPGKRIRRSGAQLLADAEKVVKLLAANKKGLRIEQINKQLGTATKQLARPIIKLLEDGRIKKTGEKRATLYFPV